MDRLSASARTERMRRIMGKDTGPELVIRRLLFGLGFRYRLHAAGLPGKPDIVFHNMRKAIFVHGCFWHRHPDESCKLARLPKSRTEFWNAKLEGNRQRDLRNQKALSDLKWTYLVVWECELRHMEQVENNLIGFLAPGGRDASN